MPADAEGALDPEDSKLATLARAVRARAHSPRAGQDAGQGAAVRDTDGRTYTGVTVENADPALSLPALRAALAAAVASGARRFEAVAVCGQRGPGDDDLAVLAEFGGAPVLHVTPDGTVTRAGA